MRPMTRLGVSGLVLGLLTTVLVVAGGMSSDAGTSGVRWLAAGDSYSSGEGLRSAGGDCQRSQEAYAPLAHAELAGELQLEALQFSACTGAVISDFDAQWREAGGGRFELVTMSFGGNDLQFQQVLEDCAGLDDPLWEIPRCDVTEDEMNRRIDGLTPALSTLYQRVAREVLAPGGRLVVLGYPRLFADPGSWSWQHSARCSAISRNDVPMLNRAAERLDRVLASASASVAGVRYESVLDDFAANGLCGRNPEWLNGLTSGVTSGVWRPERSFHPKEAGHAAEAARLAAIVRELGLRREAPTTQPPPTTGTVEVGLVLHPDRLGPLSVGMTPEEADATGAVSGAVDAVAEGEADLGYPCGFGEGSGFSAMFDDTGLVRFYVDDPAVRTPEGIGVGSSEADVRAAYGDPVVAEGDEFYGYSLRVPVGANGYVFALDGQGGSVTVAGSGRASALELVEGCA